MRIWPAERTDTHVQAEGLRWNTGGAKGPLRPWWPARLVQRARRVLKDVAVDLGCLQWVVVRALKGVPRAWEEVSRSM